MPDIPVPPLRKADFWSSLVLIAVSVAMLLEALTFPLRGTYAGVRNAWYVSPALFPLIVSATLVLLALGLLFRSVRAGGAAAALHDLWHPAAERFVRASAAFWIIGGAIAAYVYGFIPYVDFVAGTAAFLLCFTVGFHLAGTRAARTLLAALIASGVVLLAGAFAGLMPGPRTAAAYVLDAVVWAAFMVAAAVVFAATSRIAELKRRFLHCFWTSLLTAFLLSVIFKYGLLVPLPREGATVALMDPIFYALRAAL
jgi:hypothetical protein